MPFFFVDIYFGKEVVLFLFSKHDKELKAMPFGSCNPDRLFTKSGNYVTLFNKTISISMFFHIYIYIYIYIYIMLILIIGEWEKKSIFLPFYLSCSVFALASSVMVFIMLYSAY